MLGIIDDDDSSVPQLGRAPHARVRREDDILNVATKTIVVIKCMNVGPERCSTLRHSINTSVSNSWQG